MPKYPDIVKNTSFKGAKRKRKCSFNKGHLIQINEKFLRTESPASIGLYSIKKTYCLDCAKIIIEKAEGKIKTLSAQFNKI